MPTLRTPAGSSGSTSGAGSVTVSFSSAIQNGDLLLAYVGVQSATAPSAPAGWTLLSTQAAGTSSLSIFYAYQSATLTKSFSLNAAGCFIGQAYYGTNLQVYLDTNQAASNTTNNTTMPQPRPTATGNVAGDYQIIAYTWTSSATLGSVSGLTQDQLGNQATSLSMYVGHNNSTLAANTQAPAFAPTLSGNNNSKAAISFLLMDVPTPTTPIGITDPFNTGVLNTSLWTAWGSGQSMSATSLQVAPLASQSAGSYGGVFSVSGYNLTGRYFMIQIRQWLNSTVGNIQTVQLQVDSSNYLEFGQVDTSLYARRDVAGTVTSQNSISRPSAPIWLRIHEASGVIYWMYSVDTVNWTHFARFPNPITVTSLLVNIVVGTYQSVATPGTALFNFVNTPSYKDLKGNSVGQSSGGNYARNVTGDTPIGWWRLGESSGTSATDSSGRGHTGTYAPAGVTLNQAGGLASDPNTAVLLAGSSGNTGLVSIASDNDWRPSGGGWTIEAWIKPNALSGTQEFIRFGGADGWFFRSDGNTLTTLLAFSGGTYNQISGGTIPAAGVWTHVVSTYDGAFIRHYVNGKQVYSVAETRTFGPTSGNSANIGAQDVNGGEFYLGYIDEVAVYNYALLPAQISSHYAAGSTPYAVIQAMKYKLITASIAGVAVAAGQINVKRSLTGASAGKSTENGQPSAQRSLTVSSNGKATVSGTVSRRKALVGTVSSFAVTTATLLRKVALVGVASGVATVTANLTIRSSTIEPVHASGVATVSGQIQRKRSLVASAVGTTVISGIMTRKLALVGFASGVAATAGIIGRKITLIPSGSVGTSTTSTPVLSRLSNITGSANGKATTTATALLRKRSLTGVSTGKATINTAVVLRKRAISGNAVGKATVIGRPINIILILWNGSTFTKAGQYPVVLWDQQEFELHPEEGEEIDYVAYRDSTDQFNPVEV